MDLLGIQESPDLSSITVRPRLGGSNAGGQSKLPWSLLQVLAGQNSEDWLEVLAVAWSIY